MDFKDFYLNRLVNLKNALERIEKDNLLLRKISSLYFDFVKTLEKGNSIYFIGNGGSAADSSHLATEFTCKLGSRIINKEKSEKRYSFYSGVKKGKVVALTDVAAITALGNDFGYSEVFTMQLASLGEKGDLLIALSTSGSSENIIEAVNYWSNEMKNKSWLIGGKKISKNLDKYPKENFEYIALPSEETETVQELYKNLIHSIYKFV
jgi:D-sedoheptulose 7-phosphate isomerase